MSALDRKPFPASALIGASLLVLTTVVGVGIIQLHKHYFPSASSTETEGTAEQIRVLRFVDGRDGTSIYGGHVRVFDETSGTELPQLRESDGFVRAILNALTFERIKRGVDGPPIFALMRWSDSRLTIEDRVSGARINLGSFGAGNKVVFLRFFDKNDANS